MYSSEGLFAGDVLRQYHGGGWVPSVFPYLDAGWAFFLVHSLFVLSFAALALGWRTPVAKWIALVGHLSYMNANPMSWYGVDSITASLVFVMCIAPVGSCLSLDAVRRRRHVLVHAGLNAAPGPIISTWGFACTRLVQVQMAALYFYSGYAKIGGTAWQDGTALWYAMLNEEVSGFPPDVFVDHVWLIKLLTWGALVLELVYIVFIWPRLTRPFVLVGAILLHVGIIVFMNMPHFGMAMIFGHLAFFHHDWLRAMRARWVRRFGGMEMVYDGRCGFCVRSMAAFKAFDGLNLITTRDYHRECPDWISAEKASEAVYLRDRNGRVFAGFDAYRVASRRVPGLWWMAPLFHIPLLSAVVGRRLYAWVARNRMAVSRFVG